MIIVVWKLFKNGWKYWLIFQVDIDESVFDGHLCCQNKHINNQSGMELIIWNEGIMALFPSGK